MSMLSEQVKILRKVCMDYLDYGTRRLILDSADTIEALSTKVAAANMERSERYYNGGWIDFNDKLPNDKQKVLISKDKETLEDLFEFYFPNEDCEDSEVLGFLEGESDSYDGFAILKGNKDNIVWQPMPEPYRP